MALKLELHEKLPVPVAAEWASFVQSLPVLEKLKIPRFVLSENLESTILYGFIDASEKGFGAVTYVSVIKNNSDRHSQLLCSKSRVAPLKTLTIPRLELSACMLLSKLIRKVINALKTNLSQVILFSDSTIALSWIKTSSHLLKTFVANRVAKIQELIVNFSWHHISSENNPADLVSRGLSVSDLINSPLWWKGSNPSIFTNDELLENINDCEIPAERARSSKKERVSGPLSLKEINQAELWLIKLVQKAEFSNEIKNFRPPNSGGLWESGVKSFKTHLKRVAGNSNLTLEEFITLFAEIEAVLNSRPLSLLSSDFDDFETLSPGHFLIGRPVTAIIQPQLINVKENRLTRWQRVNWLSQQIWKVWKRNYLNNLYIQERSKWRFSKNNVEIGTLVLIKNESLPGTKWPTGRVLEVFYGNDNKIRVVNLKLPDGNIIQRNVRDICIFPIE
ncbi:uncharacterized protein TNCV_2564011 [Trichonephila clavipes]|nr:uncharacterized protein TNCV_2564011 [Trichonephila clavipes]